MKYCVTNSGLESYIVRIPLINFVYVEIIRSLFIYWISEYRSIAPFKEWPFSIE
jgi:hypothetical protein